MLQVLAGITISCRMNMLIECQPYRRLRRPKDEISTIRLERKKNYKETRKGLACQWLILCLLLHSLLRKRSQDSEGHFDANMTDHNVDQEFLFSPFSLRHPPARLGESQYEPVDRAEVAKLLGTSDNNKTEKKTEHESPPANCEYAVVNKKNKKVSGELNTVRDSIRTIGSVRLFLPQLSWSDSYSNRLPVRPPVRPYLCHSFTQSINQLVSQSINQLVSQSFHLSVGTPFIHSFIRPSGRSSVHSFVRSFVFLSFVKSVSNKFFWLSDGLPV